MLERMSTSQVRLSAPISRVSLWAGCGTSWVRRSGKSRDPHEEMQLSCRLRESQAVNESEIGRFVDKYFAASPVDGALPTEIVRTVASLTNGGSVAAGHVRQVLRLLEDSELIGLFDRERAMLGQQLDDTEDDG